MSPVNPTISDYSIRVFRSCDTDAVVDLWQRCDLVRPWNDPHKDIARKQADSPDLFFVLESLPQPAGIVGSVMAGYEGHRGWVNYLAIEPSMRKLGLGRKIMAHVEQELLRCGCPKINLQVRETNQDVIEFYQSLGYQIDAAVSLGKRLISDAE